MSQKKEDGNSFISSALQNSMLTGIPQIISAGNLPKKIVRSIVFVMCLTGFIYQSVTFMRIYFEYRTVVDVQVVTPSEAERPAVTVCNSWGILTQKICIDPEIIPTGVQCYVMEPDDSQDYCGCNPSYCINGSYKGVYDIRHDKIVGLNAMPYEDRKRFLATREQFVTSCEEMKMIPGQLKSNCSDPYYRQIGCYNDIFKPEVCYTFNTLIDRPDHILPKVTSDGELYFELNHLGIQYPSQFFPTQTVVFIHTPYNVVNPFVNGYKMEANMVYHFRLKKIIKKMLPYPYETNCIDYMTSWKARGGKGPTNLKECMGECVLNFSMARFGCAKPQVTHPGNHLRCREKYFSNTLMYHSIACIKRNCRPACYEEYYTSIRETSLQDNKARCGEDKKRSVLSNSIQIMMDGMETTIYTYSPKFEYIETYSYLGGYVGMWLGISLVAVFDFVETMVLMLKYPLRRFLRLKEKKPEVRGMRPDRERV